MRLYPLKTIRGAMILCATIALCLGVFAVTVIQYTSYWQKSSLSDVLQLAAEERAAVRAAADILHASKEIRRPFADRQPEPQTAAKATAAFAHALKKIAAANPALPDEARAHLLKHAKALEESAKTATADPAASLKPSRRLPNRVSPISASSKRRLQPMSGNQSVMPGQ